MARMFLVRHGQTDYNAAQILQGPRIDSGLSLLGQEQARAVGEALASKDVGGVYASPLRRARATAEAIVAARNETLPLQVVPEMYEMDYGDLSGRPMDEVRDDVLQVLDAWQIGFPETAFPGGESALLAQHRIRPAAFRLRDAALDHDVVLVAHGRINRILIATLAGISLQHLEEIPQSNGGITELDVSLDGVAITRLDDTSHLETQTDAFS